MRSFVCVGEQAKFLLALRKYSHAVHSPNMPPSWPLFAIQTETIIKQTSAKVLSPNLAKAPLHESPLSQPLVYAFQRKKLFSHPSWSQQDPPASMRQLCISVQDVNTWAKHDWAELLSLCRKGPPSCTCCIQYLCLLLKDSRQNQKKQKENWEYLHERGLWRANKISALYGEEPWQVCGSVCKALYKERISDTWR